MFGPILNTQHGYFDVIKCFGTKFKLSVDLTFIESAIDYVTFINDLE